MSDLRFNQAKYMFYELLRIMFSAGIEHEEEAIFAKQLVDFIIQHVNDCSEKGLEQEMLPIAYISVWQGVSQNNRGLFTIRAQAGMETNKDNNLSELLENLRDTVYNWGDEFLGGVIKVNGDSEVMWEIPKENEK